MNKYDKIISKIEKLEKEMGNKSKQKLIMIAILVFYILFVLYIIFLMARPVHQIEDPVRVPDDVEIETLEAGYTQPFVHTGSAVIVDTPKL